MNGRYELTERRFNDPCELDPKAQAFKRYTGVYDLRDTLSNRVIVATSSNLTSIRKMQARLNTHDVLDVGVAK